MRFVFSFQIAFNFQDCAMPPVIPAVAKNVSEARRLNSRPYRDAPGLRLPLVRINPAACDCVPGKDPNRMSMNIPSLSRRGFLGAGMAALPVFAKRTPQRIVV